ncbi:hypothetical protein KUTeg_002996 [Tegillarca granosa]|uniref:Uncharacterized protein n=1 Tax=Tegillarca granosa TaxID=220873 RepID=A0ABQ9FNS8_TEGGR|nr:hypothetical protein KUTeg_002996 [Tegillarca granosa]
MDGEWKKGDTCLAPSRQTDRYEKYLALVLPERSLRPVLAPIAVPVAVGALGFGAGGIVAGTPAAAIMASYGGAVTAGSACAIMQSIGAVGLSATGALISGAVGGVVGGATGIAAGAVAEKMDKK